MLQVTSADAQNRFGQLLDMAQREPVAITRHGRTAGYVIGPADMEILLNARERRTQAIAALESYYQRIDAAAQKQGAQAVTEDDIAQAIAEVRAQRRVQPT